MFDTCILQQKTELLELLKSEQTATQLEYCDVIASILFGGVASNESDAQYVDTLQKKYQSLALQLMAYSLSKKFGDSWYRYAASKTALNNEIKGQ